MTEGTVQSKFNFFTLIVQLEDQLKSISLTDVMDYNGDSLTIDEIEVGDLVIEINQKFIIQKPKLYPIDMIEAHPYYRTFKKDYILDFTHFRKIQSGERCRDLTIGISLIELIAFNKNFEIIQNLRNLGQPDSDIHKIADFLKTNLENNEKFTKIMSKIETKLLFVESFAAELRNFYGEEELFTLLGICLCRFNSFLEYIGGNNHFSHYRIDLLCSSQYDTWILYKKDYFLTLPSPILEFLQMIDPKPSKDLMKKMIDQKTDDIEDLILKLTQKAIISGVFHKLYQTADKYFKCFETINSIKFQETVHKIECFCCKEIINNDEVKLVCGHKFRQACFVQRVLNLTNQKVVLIEEEKFKAQPLACICGQLITEDVLKAHINNYSKYVKDAEERIKFNCQKCQYKLEKKKFLTKCKHFCSDCQIEIMRLGYLDTCYSCNVEITAQEIIALRSIKVKCVKCNSNLSSLQSFPYLLCDHNICFKCAKSCLDSKGNWTCPKDCKVRMENDQAYWYLKGVCSKCSKEFSKAEEFFMYKNCACCFCLECLSGTQESKCEKCQTNFSDYIEYLINEFKDLKQKRLRDCPVCGEKKDIDDMIMFQNCAHCICLDCMKGTAKAAYESSEIVKIFKCFDCSAPVSEEQLEEFFSMYKKNLLESTEENNIWDNVNRLKIKLDIKLSKCPQCPAEFITGDERRAYCYSCHYEYCTKCFEDYHPPDSSCQMIFINRRIIEIEELFPGEDISQCPLCKSPFIKDKDCDHVKCNECKIDFCFYCSVIRSPTLEHGNHYHRPQCAHYSPLPPNENDKMSAKCTECTKAGALCPRPVNLAKRGRYEDGETGY